MKRFYKLVSTERRPEGYAVLLDGREISTPLRNVLIAPQEALAQAILTEWAAQGETIVISAMPMTQFLNTKIDRIPRERAAMTEAVLKYLDTDLLCYRTEHPPALAEKQRELWDPWLSWFEKMFGEKLKITTGLKALAQVKEAHKKAARHVEKLKDGEFTVLQLVTSLSGSLVLALAFVKGDIAAGEVFNAARAEEHYKAGLYREDIHGPDPGQDKKDQTALADLKAAEKFLAFCRNNM